MKRRYQTYLLAGICMLAFCGCSSNYSADKDTIYMEKKGKITGVCVSDFDKDYYDADELSGYIEDTIDAYVKTAGDGTVRLRELNTDNQTAVAQIEYAGYEDYAAFNGVDFFYGDVLDAKVAGYDVPKDLQAVGKDTDEYSDDDHIVIVGQTIDVKVNGTITHVSDHVKVRKDGLASVTYDAQDLKPEPAYIVYK